MEYRILLLVRIMSLLNKIKVVNFNKVTDARGNLTAIESGRDISFEIKRVYYIYDVPGGESRGAHAHKALEQVLVAISGSFTVNVDDGKEKKSFELNRAYYGLYIPGMIWRNMDNFSTGAICLVLASDYYQESDYIRNYDEFIMECGKNESR